jgi:hypothetical protein
MTTYCVFEPCKNHRFYGDVWVLLLGLLCCFCFPSFLQNGNEFKRSFINSTFYSSGTFLVSTARHARSRAIPNTKLIHTKTLFCGNETFSHLICFLLLFIHNFILLITAWSLIQICKRRERERETATEINIWKNLQFFSGLVVIGIGNKIQTQKSRWLLKEKMFYTLACSFITSGIKIVLGGVRSAISLFV